MKIKKYMYNNVILLNFVYNFVFLKKLYEICVKNIKDVIKSGVLFVYLIIMGIFFLFKLVFLSCKSCFCLIMCI